MKKRHLICLLLSVFLLLFSGCACKHQWREATCSAPATCELCGETQGEPLAHQWEAATCEKPETCKLCGQTQGQPLKHLWKEATCTAPEICTLCGQTRGEPREHQWEVATCTTPETCKLCGETSGVALGHASGEWTQGDVDYVSAICIYHRFCTRCSEIIETNSYTIRTFHNGSVFYPTLEQFSQRINTLLPRIPTSRSTGLSCFLDDSLGYLKLIIHNNSGAGGSQCEFVPLDPNGKTFSLAQSKTEHFFGGILMTSISDDGIDSLYTMIQALNPSMGQDDIVSVMNLLLIEMNDDQDMNVNQVTYHRISNNDELLVVEFHIEDISTRSN